MPHSSKKRYPKHEIVEYPDNQQIRMINHYNTSKDINHPNLLSHWHKELEMTFELYGDCVYYLGGEPHTASSGDFVVIDPEMVHAIFPRETSSETMICAVSLLISPTLLEEIFPNHRELIFSNPSFKASSQIQSIMQKLSEIAQKPQISPQEYQFHVKGLMYQLFYHMTEEDMIIRSPELADEKIQRSSCIKKVLSYVASHFKEPLSQHDVAEKFGFCPTYFSKYFRQKVGMTFSDYLSQYRVLEARRELFHSEDTLATIAREFGFSDERQFIAAFKKKYAVTPGAFRKSVHQSRTA